MNGRQEIPTLYGVRAMATIGIFLFHSGLLPQGTFPVTLFFMLSGFLIYCRENDLNQYSNYREWLSKFVLQKVKTFYPLHVVTFIAAIFVGRVIQKGITREVIVSGLLNLFLLQPWYEPYALTFNGLSWYLSVAIFLYIIAYFMLKLLKRLPTEKLFLCISATLVLICGLSFISRFITSLYLYTNPVYRILDFALGMLMAKLYLEKGCLIQRCNIWEVGIVCVFIAQYFISLIVGGTPGFYSITFALALYILAIGRGGISRVLCSRGFKKVSYYSFEFYMVHELVLRVFRRVFADESMFYPLRCMLIAVPALVVSAGIAVGWKMLTRRINSVI